MDEDTKEKLKHKLAQLQDLFEYQLEAGEDTKAVSQKIAELERLTKD